MRLEQTVATTSAERKTLYCSRSIVSIRLTRFKDRKNHSGSSSNAMTLLPHCTAEIAVVYDPASESRTVPPKGQYSEVSIRYREVLFT